jgi:PD-(D/E)XK endonuclease
MEKRICKNCTKSFRNKRLGAKFCSSKCRNIAWRNNNPLNQYQNKISRSSAGAIGELRVSADLLSKGYNVFRAVSPACPCDLIAMKDGAITRIEVKTAKYNKRGDLYYPKPYSNQFDCLALVLSDGITYQPSLSDAS